jgi:hypothetical protein
MPKNVKSPLFFTSLVFFNAIEISTGDFRNEAEPETGLNKT